MNDRSLVVAGLALGVLVALTGCGAKEEGEAEAKPAAINGDAAPSSGLSSASALPGGPPQPQAAANQEPSDPLHPTVLIETSLGNIVVELDAEKASLTVDSFLSYVDAGHYNGTIFHQVFKDYVILGGGYTPELVEKPASRSVRNEADNGLKNRRGTIAMAREPDGIDSARAQFFINVADNPMLDHQDRNNAELYGYCVFGKVVEGMEVVDRIANVPVKDVENFECLPVETVLIKSIRRM